jgi:hypothetical protein
VSSMVEVAFKLTGGPAPGVEAARASTHNVGIREGMTLHRMRKVQ